MIPYTPLGLPPNLYNLFLFWTMVALIVVFVGVLIVWLLQLED